ncbi:MAG TPA: helix-turn-helix domain-containing protein [Ktedonobacterales bacterium]
MASKPHTKRQAQAMARREQLIHTALLLFAEKGYRGTSVRDITRAAGVNEALLYHYFTSKGALFRAVLEEHGPAQAFGALPRATPSPHPAQYALDEALRTFGRDFLARSRESRTFIITMLTEAPSNSELGAILSEFLRATHGEIIRFLAEYRQAGQIAAQVPLEAAAHVLQGSLMFYFLTEALRDPPSRAEDGQALDDIMRVVLSGLVPR